MQIHYYGEFTELFGTHTVGPQTQCNALSTYTNEGHDVKTIN